MMADLFANKKLAGTLSEAVGGKRTGIRLPSFCGRERQGTPPVSLFIRC